MDANKLQSCRDSFDAKDINRDLSPDDEEELHHWYWRMSVDPAEDEALDPRQG